MHDIIISRAYYSDCTIGRVFLPNHGFQCFSLELPWLNNASEISCISEGSYVARKRLSPANGLVYELENVLNRTFIQIHAGNYTSQILGCILVGDSIKFLNNDTIPDVTNSNNTLQKILGLLAEEITISIRSASIPLNLPLK